MAVFLKYYYQTFPDEMPQPKGEDASATPAAAKKKKHTGSDGEPEADEGESKSDIKADMHPSFPHVRFSRAPVMKYYLHQPRHARRDGPERGPVQGAVRVPGQGVRRRLV